MVIWTESAKKDLHKIHDYIANDSRHYAQKVVLSIISKAEILNTFPEMGRMVPEIMNPAIRELVIFPYRIMYDTSESNVEILAVLHGKRDFDEAFNIS
jgi:toxin ParE1/3/4